MNKKILVFVSLLALAMLAFPMSTVFAKKPVHVTATTDVAAIITPVPVKLAGGNIFFDVTGTGGIYIGDFAGTIEGIHRWHRNKDGKTNMFAELVFTGSVLGKSGSINMLCTGKAGGVVTWRIISGTDELANLHGTGTLGLGWIDGYVHFDP